MTYQTVIKDSTDKFLSAVTHYHEQIKSLRTGRASAAMLEGVVVEVYGTAMPLNQVANVSAPEAQLLQITPFDPNNVQAIAAAIRDNQSLGFNPSDDGHVVRIPVPALTEERRKEIVKQLGGKQEDAMVAVRNIRREAMDVVEKAKKDKEIGEDDAKRLASQIEDATRKTHADIESSTKAKETEIMKV